LICDTTYGNIKQKDMDAFTAEHNSRLKPGWLGNLYGLRNWDMPMASKNCPIHADDVVLDVGCGESLFFLLAAEKAKESWGVDNGNWNEFQDWFESLDYFPAYRSGRAKFRKCSAANLPFPDEMFDKVYTFSAFEHFKGDDDICAAREVYRVLKPGGYFCGTVDYNPETERPQVEDCPVKTYTLDSFLRRIVEPSELKLVGETRLTGNPVEIASIIFFLLRKQ